MQVEPPAFKRDGKAPDSGDNFQLSFIHGVPYYRRRPELKPAKQKGFCPKDTDCEKNQYNQRSSGVIVFMWFPINEQEAQLIGE